MGVDKKRKSIVHYGTCDTVIEVMILAPALSGGRTVNTRGTRATPSHRDF